MASSTWRGSVCGTSPAVVVRILLSVQIAALLVAVSVCSPASAQEDSAPAAQEVPYGPERGLRSSCHEDYAQFCAGSDVAPVPFQVACLRQSWVNLSRSCQSAIQARKQQRSDQ